MKIYFSGIGGVGLGPLAEIARDAGYDVLGSDSHQSLTTDELAKSGVDVSFDQSGEHLKQVHSQSAIDWFVYTASLPSDHPELMMAQQLGIKTSKRDELLNEIITKNGLKLIAVGGTHGKTTTTAMMVWTLQQLGIPVSYSIGSTIGFGPSGKFDTTAQYFVYECDEFDRNFLHFHPYLSLITSIDYDHPDTYPTQRDYADAFTQFIAQSEHTIMWDHDTVIDVNPGNNSWLLQPDETAQFNLAGEHNRANATLVAKACEYLGYTNDMQINQALNSFPGTSRRFEKLGDNLYSDYGHHPVEIAATLEMASELSENVILVYQPHQNTRQHQVRSGYTSCMERAKKVFWLPTYQSREDLNLPILTPEQLTERLTNKDIVSYADLNDELWQQIQQYRQQGYLVLCMGAGTIDTWLRQQLTK